MGGTTAAVLGLAMVSCVLGGKLFHSVTHFSPDCVYSDWTPWSPCSAACGVTGFSSRSRVVLEEPHHYGHKYGGVECDTSSLEEWRDCLGEPCDADCVMSEWSAWSGCSSDCGAGIRSRARDILAQPVGNGAPCGFTDQTQDCNNGPCAQDCVLGEWAPWSACPACGPGSRSRQRSVVQQGAFGGVTCDFTDLSETDACFSRPCPVDCALDQWQPWTPCSSDCGLGRRDRRRTILAQPAYGGLQCGPTDEWESCDNGPCAQDCILGEWAPWSSCPACGQASRSRQRSIIQEGAFGGRQCSFSDLSETDSCNNLPCPVDCEMSAWSEWSLCSADCGEGRRQRVRNVIVQAAYGGRPCPPAEEWESCNAGSCAVDCVMGSWSQWSQCSSQCGAGSRDRSRNIITQAAFGGRPCEATSDWESCDNGPCPQDCIIGEWSSWSSCPACGQASRSRNRQILQNGAFGGRQCDFADLAETESCNNRPCSIDCVMGSWSQWSQCSPQCGSGRRDRSRSILTQAAFGGRPCGATSDWESCNNGPCQQDCILGDWSSWSSCPACGQASRSRSRQIIQNGAFGGQECSLGDLAESESCNNRPCAVDCVMGAWTSWGQCSAPCGAGRRDRSRSVRVPAAFGGRPCGPTSDWESCSNGPCVRDCVMGAWSEWSSCCEAGVRTRWRQVAQEPAGPGARPCGSLDETEKCTPPRFPHTSRPANPLPNTPKLSILRPSRPAPTFASPRSFASKNSFIPSIPPTFPNKGSFVPSNPRRPLLTYG